MNFLEKDLEEIIYNSDRNGLEKRGLLITGKLLRQVRIGNYGVADLIEFNRDIGTNRLFITVYELKKEKIGISAFLQAVGYAKGIIEYIEIRKPDIQVYIDIVLIGSIIDQSSSFCYLPELLPTDQNGLSFLSCYTYEYDFDGIHFTNEYGYKLTDNGFNLKENYEPISAN